MKTSYNKKVLDVYIIHYRWDQFGEVVDKKREAFARGGYTFAFSCLDGHVFGQYAQCSDKDNYCKKTGRDLAIHRLLSYPVALGKAGDFPLPDYADLRASYIEETIYEYDS